MRLIHQKLPTKQTLGCPNILIEGIGNATNPLGLGARERHTTRNHITHL